MAIEEAPLAERRGCDPESIVEAEWHLIRAPIGRVADALAAPREGAHRRRDAYGEVVDFTRGCALFQLRGHEWTMCARLRGAASGTDEARALSGVLATEAIAYGYENVSGSTYYELFDRGERVERYEASCEGEYDEEFDPDADPADFRPSVTFTSTTRRVDPGDIDPIEFIDPTFREHDAYGFFPPLGPSPDGSAAKARLADHRFRPDDFAGVEAVEWEHSPGS